ncbi:hypothetical protein F5884DRAFT_679177 [Xylogone sp. PMI_703]|nr:hypothetical protein F5884DRAFT_679177 [Xylogone sp. PMI_703]
MGGGEADKLQRNLTHPWRIYLYGVGATACRHAATAGTLENVQLFAADPSPNARDAFIDKFPLATVYDDAETMLTGSAAQDRDIVIIAVPPWLHHSATLHAFRSKRHVLCEKPVATSEAELAEMLAASRSSGRLFGECSIRFLENKALDHARQLIAARNIGTPYHARLVNRQPRARPGIEYQPQSRWFLDKQKAGGGTIFDWGVYDLAMIFDALRPVAVTVHYAWMATPPTGADPSEHPVSVETHAGAAMELKLESGDIVSFDYERACGFHGEPQTILNVDGSAGGLTWQWVPTADSDEAAGSFQLIHFTDVEGAVNTREENFPAFGWDGSNARPLLSFIDLIEGHDSIILPPSKIEFNFAILAAIYKSASEHVAVRVELKPEV